MNILSITAGAADMYCGSCLRDNALAAALLARGHQVTLLPIYTPTITDEPNVSSGQRVFFGGISVYLEQHFPLFRHTPWLMDRLWDAPGVIKQLASRAVQVDPNFLGAMTVSTLQGEGGYQRKEVEKLLHWLRGEPRPDLVNLPNALLIALASSIRRALDRPVVVTLQGEDLFLEGLPEPYKTQALGLVRSQVGTVDLFVSVSEYYTDFMAEYLSIPRGRLRTVPLGVNVKDLRPPPKTGPALSGPDHSVRSEGPGFSLGTFTIGFFARIAPEKGLHNLAEAYRILRQERDLPPSRLLAAGYMSADHAGYLAGIQRMLAASGLEQEFSYRGTVDRAAKVRFFHELDVLSVPSDYHEPKGLYLLEAMACGVPVVQPNHGAFPEMLQRTGGGVLADSARPADIADTILALWRDPARRAALGQRGAQGVRDHYTVDQMADRTVEVYSELLNTQPQHSRALEA